MWGDERGEAGVLEDGGGGLCVGRSARAERLQRNMIYDETVYSTVAWEMGTCVFEGSTASYGK